MILFETPHLQNIREGMIPILYTGVIEVAVAYTLQIIGQKYTPPIIAAVILSMEAVFASICGVIFLGEIMSVREIIGCIFMFAAIIISQIPERNQLVEKIELNER